MNLQIDQYAHLNSLIHRWSPRLKLVGLMVLIFAFASVEDLVLIPPMVVVTLTIYALSRLPLSFLRSRLRYPGFFLLGIVLFLPWFSGETVIWHWGWLSLRLEGVLAVLLIASRFFCILTMGLVLLGTMPFLTTIKAMRSLGLPPLLADMTLLTYRYLYDVADNLTTMRRAMRLRGFGQRSRHQRRWAFIPDWHDLNMVASLTGSLFIRSYERSESIYRAMRLRGYGQSQGGSEASVRQSTAAASQPLAPWADRVLLVGVGAIALGLFLAAFL